MVAPTSRRPVSTSALSRCQSFGRKRHIQPSSMPTTRTASRNQPKRLATSGPGLAETERLDLLDVLGRQLLAAPDDDLARQDLDPDRQDGLGPTVALLLGQLCAERRVRHDERADELRGERPFGVVEVARHQAGETGPRLGDLGVAQLGAQQRVEDARGLGPEDRPSVPGSSPTSVARRLGAGRAPPSRAATRAARRAGRRRTSCRRG